MQTKKAKKILVTGGAGFLGSYLCKNLIKLGNYVICIDNLSSGNKTNITSIIKSKKFKFIRKDVSHIKNFKVDEIYNLACPASPAHYQADPTVTFKTNVLGILNLLEIAKKNNAKILQASTSEIYGDPLTHPQKETDWGNVNPIGIRSCYDEGKRSAETIMFDYYRSFKTKIKIVRIFNTYGPNMLQNDGRVISNFIVQCLKNKPITIYGSGKQTRSFCYVNDMIDGLVKTMRTSHTVLGPINLGNPNEYRIIEIAKMIRKLTNSKSSFIFKKLPKDDPRRRRPSISRAKKLIKWYPQTDLETGLTNTIEYFDKLLQKNPE